MIIGQMPWSYYKQEKNTLVMKKIWNFGFLNKLKSVQKCTKMYTCIYYQRVLYLKPEVQTRMIFDPRYQAQPESTNKKMKLLKLDITA